jgi:hypothetical protein
MMSSNVLDRAALYYPYIHIRPDKIDWLKATLLCFPQVRRMAPEGYNLRDRPEVIDFLSEKNADGNPLLDVERLDMDDQSSAAARAQERLLNKLQHYNDIITKRYAGKNNKHKGKKGKNYTIHREKIHGDIWRYLVFNNLVKASGSKRDDPYGEWVDIEPELGDAIMSTIAIAVSRSKGLDIVTSDSTVHNAIVTQSEDEVFNSLLNLGETKNTPSDADKVEELAQVVIQTKFDVSQLNVAQIAELHKEGKSLMAFKKALLPIASQIPHIEDAEERQRQFRRKAEEVIEEWESYKRKLPGFAMAALVEAQEIKAPEYALNLVVAGTAMWMPIVGASITLGVLSYKGYSIWKKFKEGQANPYKYLSQIERKGASLFIAPPTD